jgi:hypothetical protein
MSRVQKAYESKGLLDHTEITSPYLHSNNTVAQISKRLGLTQT